MNFMVKGYYYLRPDGALFIDKDIPGEESSYSDNKWIAPKTSKVENLNNGQNILHLQGIHNFFVQR